MIKLAFEQLQNRTSKNPRYLFMKGKTRITACSEQGFPSIYSKYEDRFLGSFTKDISYEDFEVEVQAAINEILANDAHIDAIEAEHGNGCGQWVNHSCGVPYRWDQDELPTQREVKHLKTIAPVQDYGRKLYKPETLSAGLLHG